MDETTGHSQISIEAGSLPGGGGETALVPISTPDEYQERAAATAIYPKDVAREYLIIGIADEAIETHNETLSTFADSAHPDYQTIILKELGDMAWYIAMLLREMSRLLSEVEPLTMDEIIDAEEALSGYAVQCLSGHQYISWRALKHAGDLLGKMKKSLRGDERALDDDTTTEIVRRIMHYMDLMANLLGADMTQVYNMNLQKLESRKARGKLRGEGDDR